jgi:hypothetical protein
MDWQKIKEKIEDHIVGLIFLLVTFLCGVVWQAVPSETWTRLEAAISTRAIAAVSVLLLIGLSTALAYIFSLRKQLKNTEDSKNSFHGLRVLNDDGNMLDVEVWYFCSPPALEENDEVRISVDLLNKSGHVLPDGEQVTYQEIKIFNHKARAILYLVYTPSKGYEAQTSTHIRLCMEEWTKGTFHCQTFRHRKVWKPKP